MGTPPLIGGNPWILSDYLRDMFHQGLWLCNLIKVSMRVIKHNRKNNIIKYAYGASLVICYMFVQMIPILVSFELC